MMEQFPSQKQKTWSGELIEKVSFFNLRINTQKVIKRSLEHFIVALLDAEGSFFAWNHASH